MGMMEPLQVQHMTLLTRFLLIIYVYPNPTFGNITIDLAIQQSEVQITLYDMYGKLAYLNKYQDSKLIEFSFDAPPGIYYLDIKSGERTSRHKL